MPTCCGFFGIKLFEVQVAFFEFGKIGPKLVGSYLLGSVGKLFGLAL